MADQNVQIVYEAVVRGQEKVADLAKANEQLKTQTEAQTKTVARLTQEHQKHDSALLKARQGILAFRRELFAITFAAAAVGGALVAISKSSDLLGERLEKLGDLASDVFGAIGDSIGKAFGAKDDASGFTKSQNVARLLLSSENLKLQGDNYGALIRRLEAEEIKFLDSIRSISGQKRQIVLEEFRERKRLLLENQRLEELGLKSVAQIRSEFFRNAVSGSRSQTGDVIFKTLQGERQSAGDILKGFQEVFNRGTADFLSEMLFTKLFAQKADPTVVAIKEGNSKRQEIADILKNVQNCVCNLVKSAGQGTAIGGFTATLTNPKASFADKLGAVAKLGSSLGGLGGLFGLGAADAGRAGVNLGQDIGRNAALNVDYQSIFQKRNEHSGGFVSAFPSGGEVPIMAQPGEFVVRRAAAQENRDALAEINSGSRRVRGTQNVFLIKANDAQSFTDMLSSPSSRAMIEIAIIDAIRKNGNVRNAIKQFAS